MTATMTMMAELKAMKARAEAEYVALVESVASGEEIDAGTVSLVLADAGKTPDEFVAAVQAKSERLRLKALADTYDSATAELLAARAEVERQQAELNEVTAKLSAQIRDGQRRCEELTKQVAEAKQAGRDLWSNYRGPLREQAALIRQRIDAADARLTAIKRDVVRLEQQLLAVQANPDDYHTNVLGLTQGSLDARRKAMAQATAERDAALAESNAITEQMRQP